MIRFIAALIVAGIGWIGIMATQKFHYKALSRKQLAQMVYNLNRELVEFVRVVPPGTVGTDAVMVRAQKMINRAKLEGLL